MRYGLERLLYRLGTSAHGKRFYLKGALLFHVWGQDDHRATRDADLLGSGASDSESIAGVFRELCGMPFEDGIAFDASSVNVEQIAQDKAYSGLRVTLGAEVDGARIPVQVDVGFGDVVTPEAEVVRYPTLLEFPPPELRAYPVYTVIAEKFHAMVVLGEANSRMKDFYDLWAIARRFDLQGALLTRAIAATFQRRKTEIPKSAPVALSSDFGKVRGKAAQWAAFIRRNRLPAGALTLEGVQAAVSALVLQPAAAAREGRGFDLIWKPGGPWKEGN